MIDYKTQATPGTLIEIKERIVRKDISFIDPQRKFIDTDVKPLRPTLFGNIAIEIASVTLESFPQYLRLVGGGMYAYE